MDSPQTPPTVPQASAPQPAANLNTPELPKQPAELPPPHRTSWGAFVGIVIIILVLIVGALYFWGAKLTEEERQSSSPAEEILTESFAP